MKQSDPGARESLKSQRNSDNDIPTICKVANTIVQQDIATALDDPSYPYVSRRHIVIEAHAKYFLNPDK